MFYSDATSNEKNPNHVININLFIDIIYILIEIFTSHLANTLIHRYQHRIKPLVGHSDRAMRGRKATFIHKANDSKGRMLMSDFTQSPTCCNEFCLKKSL